MKVLLFVKNSPNAISTAEVLEKFLENKKIQVEFFVNEPGKKTKGGRLRVNFGSRWRRHLFGWCPLFCSQKHPNNGSK